MRSGEADSLAALPDSAELVLAPELIIAEVVNTFWKYLRAGVLFPTAERAGRPHRAVLIAADETLRRNARNLGIRTSESE